MTEYRDLSHTPLGRQLSAVVQEAQAHAKKETTRPEWKFHRYSTTRSYRDRERGHHLLRFTVTSAEYITVSYDGHDEDVINTFNRAGEPTIYTRADFLRHVDEYMAEPQYIRDIIDNT